jgi:hypothetical protein
MTTILDHLRTIVLLSNEHIRVNDQDGLCETCLSIARDHVAMTGGVLSWAVTEIQGENHK